MLLIIFCILTKFLLHFVLMMLIISSILSNFGFVQISLLEYTIPPLYTSVSQKLSLWSQRSSLRKAGTASNFDYGLSKVNSLKKITMKCCFYWSTRHLSLSPSFTARNNVLADIQNMIENINKQDFTFSGRSTTFLQRCLTTFPCCYKSECRFLAQEKL